MNPHLFAFSSVKIYFTFIISLEQKSVCTNTVPITPISPQIFWVFH